MKICNTCNIEKTEDNFYRRNGRPGSRFAKCKICCAQYTKEWILKNPDRVKELKRKAYNENKISYYLRNKQYKKTDAGKESQKKSGRKWSAKKRKEDINFRLKMNLRNATKNALKWGSKGGSAISNLGCSIEIYRSYLESKFQPNMSWDNYGAGPGKWNIDYIKPLSKFDLSDGNQFLEACHYTNTQPMWSEENLKKGNK